MLVPCETCEGTGRIRLGHLNDPFSNVMPCDAGCVNGQREPTLAELDGCRARYRYAVGPVFLMGDKICIESEDFNYLVVGIPLDKLEILSRA